MSNLDLDRNIFELSADTSIGDVLEAGFDSTIQFRTNAQLKRGIDLEIGASAMAELNVAFTKFLAAGIEGRAEAMAQLKAQIQAPLDLFSEAGLAVRLQAVAQLALSARFAVGISIGDFLQLAYQDSRITGIYIRLLEVFLEELEIQAGVRGRVAYSAMAYFNMVIAGRLVEDSINKLKPGFTIAMNCGVGLKGGGGWGFFANLGLKNPRRYFKRTVDVTVDELVARIQDEIDNDAYIELIPFIRTPAKIALRGGFELGYALAENVPNLANSGPELAQQCVQLILEELQRTILENISTLGISLIRTTLHEIGADQNAWDNSQEEREAFAAQLRDMPEDPFNMSLEAISYWSGVVNSALGVIITLSSTSVPDHLMEAISLMWASAQLVFATTERVADASVRSSFFGTFSAEQRVEAFQGQIVNQMPAPNLVKAFINAKLNRDSDEELSQKELVLYLSDTAMQRLIDEMPEARQVLEIVAGPNTEPDALAAAANMVLNNAGAFVTTGTNNTVDPEASLRALSEGLKAYINTRIRLELVPIIYDAVGDQSELRIYLDDVILPTMSFTLDTAFDSILDWSSSNTVSRDALREACSSIVMQLSSRSLVVTTDILMTHAATQVSDELSTIAQTVDDPGNLADQIAEALELDKQLVREVLHESLEICAEVLLPMPDETRAKIRTLLYTIMDNVPTEPDADWVARLQQDTFIPNERASIALLELSEELGVVLAGYLKDFFIRVLTRVAQLVLQELEELVEALVQQTEVWIEELELILQAVVNRLMALPGEILRVANRINFLLSRTLQDVRSILGQFPNNPEDLHKSLTSALFTSALPLLREDDNFFGLIALARELAESSLSTTVNAGSWPLLVKRNVG